MKFKVILYCVTWHIILCYITYIIYLYIVYYIRLIYYINLERFLGNCYSPISRIFEFTINYSTDMYINPLSSIYIMKIKIIQFQLQYVTISSVSISLQRENFYTLCPRYSVKLRYHRPSKQVFDGYGLRLGNSNNHAFNLH